VPAGTVTLVVPPGFTCDAAVIIEGVGACSIPKFTLAIFAVVTVKVLVMPLTVPSPAAAVPSPVFTQPEGSVTAGAAAPTVPAFVEIRTVKVPPFTEGKFHRQPLQ
jgi:hypothetical protein